MLKLSGCDYFFTQKLSWNNINKFPLTTFYWVGIDGTRILAHLTPADTWVWLNPTMSHDAHGCYATSYNATVTVAELNKWYASFHSWYCEGYLSDYCLWIVQQNITIWSIPTRACFALVTVTEVEDQLQECLNDWDVWTMSYVYMLWCVYLLYAAKWVYCRMDYLFASRVVRFNFSRGLLAMIAVCKNTTENW